MKERENGVAYTCTIAPAIRRVSFFNANWADRSEQHHLHGSERYRDGIELEGKEEREICSREIRGTKDIGYRSAQHRRSSWALVERAT